MSDGPHRDGDNVRRPVRPNTALVLDVLWRLEAAGATWAPRSRGIDDGFEVLSWLDGDTPTDGAEIDLDALARMVRELHDLTAPLAAGFADGAECLIHDDLQPRNVVVQDGRPVGLIDWEQARPGRRIEDVADLCWSFVEPVQGSDPVEIGRRWRGVLDAYGLDARDRAEVVPTALARMAACIDDIVRHTAAGSERHRVLADRGDHVALQAMLDWTSVNQDTITEVLTLGTSR
jgi:Ser/Thr protein kinase RdoA (MazF antagonist)